MIRTTNKYYVEFGVENGTECNTRNLRQNYNWTGLLMDGEHSNDAINLKAEFITAENIVGFFEKYNVPKEFDLLSIDIDFNDFHLWKAIGTHYRPRVVIIEYNGILGPDEDKVVPYSATQCWDGTHFFGASLLAYYYSGKSLGYSLVCTDKRSVNSFFIRNDVIEKSPINFKDINNVKKLYNLPFYGDGHYRDYKERSYILAQQLLGLDV